MCVPALRYVYLPFDSCYGEPDDGRGGPPILDPGTLYVIDAEEGDEVWHRSSLMELALNVLRDKRAEEFKEPQYKAIADAFVQAANLLYVAIGQEVR